MSFRLVPKSVTLNDLERRSESDSFRRTLRKADMCKLSATKM